MEERERRSAHGVPRRVALALAAAVFGRGVPARGQVYLAGRFRLTEYWIAAEASVRALGRPVRITDRAGATLAWTSPEFASALAMEGTGRTWDGRLLNWAARVRGRACFVELDPERFPYGAGVRGFALVPYRSLAVDARFVPLGHTVELAELAGLPLPDGSRHDGCFVAVDGGGAIRGHHLDLFLPTYEVYAALARAGWTPPRVHVVVDAPRCAWARRFAVLPVPGDPAPR